jgi:hypothetical protein
MRDQKKNCVTTVCTIDTNDISVSGTGNTIEFKNECASDILKEPTPEEKQQEEEKHAENKEINDLITEKQEKETLQSTMYRWGIIISLLIVGIILFLVVYRTSTIMSIMIVILIATIIGIVYYKTA